MEITVLADNALAEGLCSEWGLSLCVRRGNQLVLLDFGQSDAFARNATQLGIDLSEVDISVLSHAHYDHADGMEAFFAANAHAPLYVSETCSENCWSTKGGTSEAHYIGIHPGYLDRFSGRIVRVATNRTSTIAPGIHLVPHTTPGLTQKGQRDGMWLQTADGWHPDGFAHELSLVVEADDAPDAPIVVLNSCSHAGPAAITREVKAAFPQRRIAAFVGGLHLMRACDASILDVAQDLLDANIEHVYTGHCTGDRALELLSSVMPGRVTQLHPGLTLRIGG